MCIMCNVYGCWSRFECALAWCISSHIIPPSGARKFFSESTLDAHAKPVRLQPPSYKYKSLTLASFVEPRFFAHLFPSLSDSHEHTNTLLHGVCTHTMIVCVCSFRDCVRLVGVNELLGLNTSLCGGAGKTDLDEYPRRDHLPYLSLFSLPRVTLSIIIGHDAPPMELPYARGVRVSVSESRNHERWCVLLGDERAKPGDRANSRALLRSSVCFRVKNKPNRLKTGCTNRRDTSTGRFMGRLKNKTNNTLFYADQITNLGAEKKLRKLPHWKTH